jgi:predicted nucleotidyltransferase
MLTITDIQMAVNKIAPQYPIRQVHLFGSYAEGNATTNSDVDVIVEFKNRPVTLLDFCGFQQELSELLKVDVDILKSPLSDATKKNMSIEKVVRLYG